MVDDEFADASGAGAVETDAGQIAGIGRQDEVAVAGGDEGQHHQGIYTEADTQGSHGGDGGGLAVNELGDDKQDDGIGPWFGGHNSGKSSFQ